MNWIEGQNIGRIAGGVLPEGASVSECKTQPTPQTVGDLLDQRLTRLHQELARTVGEVINVRRLRARTPLSILRGSAADLRELVQLL